MKKLSYLIVLLVLFTITVKAQKPVIFKFKYLPRHDYASAIKLDMDINMSMTGDSAANEKIKSQGIKQPMLIKMNMTTATDVKTGQPKADKTFPFTLNYNDLTTKMSMNGADMPMPTNPVVGQKIYGDCDAEGNLHVDSMSVKNVNAQVKAAMTELMNKMQKQIKFPDRPLAVGESFSQYMPMNLPVTGMSMDVNVKTTYTLTAIKEGKGYFDMAMAMKLDMNLDKNAVTLAAIGNGTGTGKVVFSILQNYPLSMLSNLDMKLNMDIKTMKIAMDMKMVSDMENTITAN